MCLFTDLEIKTTMFQIGALKASEPDGLVASFYQKNWDVVGNTVVQTVQAFLNSGIMLRELNHTLITLIPKVP